MAMTDDFLPDHYALRWNNFFHNLSAGFASHLNNKNFVDVTIAVEGKLLDAHKIILSICSQYFEDIFKSNPCQHPVVILQDMKYSEVDMMIKFMYRGEINVKQEDLARFLKVAEVLKVKGLTLDPTMLQNSPDTKNSLMNSKTSRIEKPFTNHNVVHEKNPNATQQEIEKNNQTNNLSILSSKKNENSSIILNNSTDKIYSPHFLPAVTYDIGNNSSGKNSNNIINTNDILPRKHEIPSSDESIDLTKDDECNNNSELYSANIINHSSQTLSNTEPVTYTLSTRGRPQLVHSGYVYNLTSRSAILNRSHYRCVEQHHGCRGKCAVIAERFIPTGIKDHNHSPPGYYTKNDCKRTKVTRS